MRTVFLRVLEAEDKRGALLQVINNHSSTLGGQRFELNPTCFSAVPRSPFSYWVSDRLRNLFTNLPPFESDGRIARKGLTTSNDMRYVRAWWEVAPRAYPERWATYAKGGSARTFFMDPVCVVRWDWSQRTLPGYLGRAGRETSTVECADLMGNPGLTWPLRAAKFSPSVLPSGSVFSARGYVIQAPSEDLMWILALTASTSFDSLFKMCLGRRGHPEFVVGVLQRLPLPIPSLSPAIRARLSALAEAAWSLSRALDTRVETSHAFVLPALLQCHGSLAQRASAWEARVRATEVESASIVEEIDAHCFKLFGICDEDRHAVIEDLGGASEAQDEAEETEEEAGTDVGDEEDTETAAPTGLTAELVSWAIGVAFGRFDLSLANGARLPPGMPKPFGSLPACSPAMLTGDDGLPCRRAPIGYPIDFPERGILVDDPGHAHDLTAAVQTVFREVFGREAEARWEEATKMLAPGARGLRGWLMDVFFEHHLKRYSRSGRRAPIYWQLSIPSGQYSVWLYAHRVTRDSLFELQTDVVAPKLAHEENRLADLRAGAAAHLSAAKRREVEAQERLVEDLRVMLEEVRRVAPLWSPFLDDGVVLTMAPLWRLAPQHRAWQRELKSRWDDLIDEKYEWAQMAMHLWPERVVPKCAMDRSLAIAHELEDAFWVEGLDRRWRQRGAIDSTMRYLEDGLLSESLRATVIDLKRFAQQHIEQQSEAGWWVDLKSGRHDDTPLALALWPDRVLRRARAQPSLLGGLGLPLPARGFDDRALAALLKRYRPRHSEADLEVLDAFCATVGNAAAWETRWADLDIGRLDEQPLARFLYPRRVLARALTDHAFAAGHDLARWFWLNTPAGPRRLREPEEEVKIALAERDRPAMKAALKAFLESPVAPGSARRERRVRSA